MRTRTTALAPSLALYAAWCTLMCSHGSSSIVTGLFVRTDRTYVCVCECVCRLESWIDSHFRTNGNKRQHCNRYMMCLCCTHMNMFAHELCWLSFISLSRSMEHDRIFVLERAYQHNIWWCYIHHIVGVDVHSHWSFAGRERQFMLLLTVMIGFRGKW